MGAADGIGRNGGERGLRAGACWGSCCWRSWGQAAGGLLFAGRGHFSCRLCRLAQELMEGGGGGDRALSRPWCGMGGFQGLAYPSLHRGLWLLPLLGHRACRLSLRSSRSAGSRGSRYTRLWRLVLAPYSLGLG